MNLSDKAMLVNLSISAWSGRKLDRKITGEVTAAHGADRDAGRWNKNLVLGSALDEVKKAAGDSRTFHYFNSLPWTDDGSRILTAALFLKYSGEIGKLERAFNLAVDKFIQGYSLVIDNARISLGDMFNESDYPSESEVRGKFSFQVKFLPLPSGDDFRVDLSAGDVARIKADIECQLQAATSAAMTDLWSRLHGAVRAMADKLKDGDAIFRDSLVGNIKELVDILPALNLTGDAALTAAVVEVKNRLACYSPDVLRFHEIERSQVAAAADEIARKMSGYCGGVL